MKKKLFAFLSFMVLLGSTAIAQTGQNCVVVETTAGQRMAFLLSDQPRIVHGNAAVTLTTDKTSMEFQTNEVAKVYLTLLSANAIEEVKTASGSIQLSGDRVSLTGFAPREAVRLFTADGKLQMQQSADDKGCLVVALDQLRAGIYILKTNHQSVKVTKK
jgi:hypothetical protein